MKKFIFILFFLCFATNSYAWTSCMSNRTAPDPSEWFGSGSRHVGGDHYQYFIYTQWIYVQNRLYGDEPSWTYPWSRCSYNMDSDFDGCRLNDGNYAPEGNCLANLQASGHFDGDTDGDGYSDIDEIVYNGDMYDDQVFPQYNGPDSDNDGINDAIEILIGTDPEVANDFVSGDYSTYSIENYEPVEKTYAVVIELTDDSYFVFETFTLGPLSAFGSPEAYTLGNYGDMPDGLVLNLAEVNITDGVPTYSNLYALSSDGTTNDDLTVWDVPELVTYIGSVGDTGIGSGVTNSVDNTATADQAWDDFLEALSGITLSATTDATVQIDPLQIAAGVKLAISDVAISSLPGIEETEDSEIDGEVEGASSLLDDFGATDYDSGDVLTKEGTESAISVLSWVDDLYQIPEIGSQSEFIIEGWEYNGKQFPQIVLDFDHAIVPVVRTLFLFFFYLGCVWIFFKLTRYGWG